KGSSSQLECSPSQMADPSRGDYSESLPTDALWSSPSGCANTLSNRNTGRSDWATIQRFYTRSAAQNGFAFALTAPTSYNPYAGPALLPLAVTTISELAPPSAPRTVTTPLFSLTG